MSLTEDNPREPDAGEAAGAREHASPLDVMIGYDGYVIVQYRVPGVLSRLRMTLQPRGFNSKIKNYRNKIMC
jgi:hypothetical protein